MIHVVFMGMDGRADRRRMNAYQWVVVVSYGSMMWIWMNHIWERQEDVEEIGWWIFISGYVGSILLTLTSVLFFDVTTHSPREEDVDTVHCDRVTCGMFVILYHITSLFAFGIQRIDIWLCFFSTLYSLNIVIGLYHHYVDHLEPGNPV